MSVAAAKAPSNDQTKISRAAPAPEVRQMAGASAPAIITLLLPSPPSVNALFRNVPGRGRVKSELYDRWKGEAGWRLRAQYPASIQGPVLILIGVERTNVLADIDNRIKPTLDLLVEHGVIQDDRFVIGVAAAWSPRANAMMRVAVIPAADVAVRFHLASDGAHGGWFIEAPDSQEGEA